MRKIAKAYTRFYPDNGQTFAFVEWSDGSITQAAIDGNCLCCGAPRSIGAHMTALFNRAKREGVYQETGDAM